MKQDITKRDTHIKAEEPQDSDIRTARPDVSVPRVSAAPLKKGWGGEGFRYDSTDVPQRRRRLSNEGAFFSKKSFRDVGCSDYMVDALRVQLIHRPSHIQVFLVNAARYCFEIIIIIIVIISIQLSCSCTISRCL